MKIVEKFDILLNNYVFAIADKQSIQECVKKRIKLRNFIKEQISKYNEKEI